MHIQGFLPEFTLSKTEGVEMTIEPKQGFSFGHYIVCVLFPKVDGQTMNYLLFADITVVLHLAYACFVVLGVIAIVTGGARGWNWVRNYRFRLLHLICTIVVPLETLGSITCPLTTLENFFLKIAGREGYHRSFIGNLSDEILFYEAPEWVFAIIYVAMALLVVLYFILSPPLRSSHSSCDRVSRGN